MEINFIQSSSRTTGQVLLSAYFPKTLFCVYSVSQSCPTVEDTKYCSLKGYAVHKIFQARIPEWVAISFSGVSS